MTPSPDENTRATRTFLLTPQEVLMSTRVTLATALLAGCLGAGALAAQPAAALPAARSPIPKSELCRQALAKIELYRSSSNFTPPSTLTILDQTRTVDLQNLDPARPPFSDPSRVMWYRSMLWLVIAAVDAGERGKLLLAKQLADKAIGGASAIRDPGTATESAKQWALALGWDAGTTIRRAEALLCLSTMTGVQPVRQLLRDQAVALMDAIRYGGPPHRAVSNAGMMANLVLLNIAQRISAPNIRKVAIYRLLRDQSEVFSPLGWTNEASTSYHSVNVRGWRDVQAVLRKRRYVREAAALDARLAAASRTARQLIGPTRLQALIGNSRPDDVIVRPPATGLPLLHVDVPGGLAVGRWSWTDRGTTWWTAQNRLKQGAHGHQDNLSLTWQADGLPILTDPGQPDYDRWNNPMTAWSRTPEAHNRAVPAKIRRDRVGLRRMVVIRTGALDDIRLTTTDLGSEQTRRILVDDTRSTVEVVDTGERRMVQHWHFGPDWVVSQVTDHLAVLTGPGGRVVSVSAPDGSISAHFGSMNPIAGWRVTGFEQQVPATELRIAGSKSMTTTFDLLRSARARTAPIPSIARTSVVKKRSVLLRWTLPDVVTRATGPARLLRAAAKATGYRVQLRAPRAGWQTVRTDTRSPATRATIARLRTESVTSSGLPR